MPHFPQFPNAPGSEVDALEYRGACRLGTNGPITFHVSPETHLCLALFQSRAMGVRNQKLYPRRGKENAYRHRHCTPMCMKAAPAARQFGKST